MDKDLTSNSNQKKQHLKLQMVIAIVCNILDLQHILVDFVTKDLEYLTNLV